MARTNFKVQVGDLLAFNVATKRGNVNFEPTTPLARTRNRHVKIDSALNLASTRHALTNSLQGLAHILLKLVGLLLFHLVALRTLYNLSVNPPSLRKACSSERNCWSSK